MSCNQLTLKSLSIFAGTSTKDNLGFIGTNEETNSERHLLNWGNENVHYAEGFSFRTVLNVPKGGFIVIILLHNSNANTNPTNQQYKTFYRPLTNPLYDILIDNAIDVAVVKGLKAPVKCTKLMDIFSNIAVTGYFTAHLDISIQRGKSYSFCSRVLQPNMQSHFHIAQSSKGLENDCPGIQMDLVQELPRFVDDSIDARAVDLHDICENNESSLQVRAEKVKKFLFEETPNAECRADDRDMATKDMKNSASRKRKRNMMNDQTFSDFPWEDKSHFKEQWIEDMRNHQKHIIPVGEISQIKNWFEYLPAPPGSEAESRYRCRICHTYRKTAGYGKGNYVPEIAKDNGVLKLTKKENRDELTSHSSSKIHTAMINHLKSSKTVEMQDIRQYEPGTSTATNAVTNRVMR